MTNYQTNLSDHQTKYDMVDSTNEKDPYQNSQISVFCKSTALRSK